MSAAVRPLHRQPPTVRSFVRVVVCLSYFMAIVTFGRLAEAADERAPNAIGHPYQPTRKPAPEFDGGLGWLNTTGDITLKDLRGKIVLLDFWTFCCVNCMHILPDLKYLEQKFDKQLVVIGVHSAKFENEKDSESIRSAIMRYGIEHPVINDGNLVLWTKYGVDTWPSFAVIDPDGYLCYTTKGEGHRDAFEHNIERLISFYRRIGKLDESSVRFDLERRRTAETPLRFPGKVLADPVGRRLFIADSSHSRIVVTTLDGKLIDTIGSGAIGKANGPYAEASFDHPQGMALVGETLYVADTDNHLIRAVDLAARHVETVAGNGKQAPLDRRPGGAALRTPLSTPWDLVAADGKIYIAMAGNHQIWFYDPKKHVVDQYAGTTREDVTNGPLRSAAFGQPSGITTDGKMLYVADAEGSAIRKVPLSPRGDVTTLVGTSDLPNGASLFAFGDADGVGQNSRLQHPLGVAYHDGKVYVADSYNHKLKQVDPTRRTLTTWLGDGRAGSGDSPAQFSEPGGLSFAGNMLYVADTNNHAIRKVDLRTGEVSTLEIKGLEPPPAPRPSDTFEVEARKPTHVKPQRIAANKSLAVAVELDLPAGFKLNPEAPITYRLKAHGSQTLVSEEQLQGRHEIDHPEHGEVLHFEIPLAASVGKGELQLSVSYGYCRSGADGFCKFPTLGWVIPIELAADAEETVLHLSAR